MTGFIIRRIGAAIPILFGVSVVGFLLMKILPGDPTFYLLGPWAGPAAREALLAKLGWDQSLPTQYWRGLSAFVMGDFGTSTTYGIPVATILSQRVGNSAVSNLSGPTTVESTVPRNTP